ncbi:hypothetical protein BCR43DRAFT_76750 [Syncephalastrum racemosum]|uniref:Uncharacterized protein n=1 Tax=Syncephalastrum racemosum TaxID=13706 RepID=A0A1X2H2G2_SYNRA|nr:hypothetical protein BCR43DRAFT_76750 [Syncephalastrum racemosum]
MSALTSLSVAEFLFLFAQLTAAMQSAVVAKMFRISTVVVATIGLVGTCLDDLMNDFVFDCCHCIVLTFVCFIFIVLAVRSLSVTALTISNIFELIIAPQFLFASACFDQLLEALFRRLKQLSKSRYVILIVERKLRAYAIICHFLLWWL